MNYPPSSPAHTTFLLAALTLLSVPAWAQPSMLDPIVTQVAVATSHTCVITTDGGVKCWGKNFSGQLGDNSATDSLAPVDVSGLASGVVAITVDDHHTCALTTGGGVKCWGNNGYGQLGDNTTLDRLTPVDVAGLASGVAAIAAGDHHTCALTTEGVVKCWGYNAYGQLGDNSTIDRHTPVDVSGMASGVAAIAAGAYHSCALTMGGGVKCWGRNVSGQLGDGSNQERSTPVDVQGLASGVATIAAGFYHTCALTTGGGAKCWGDNYYGQLGDNSTTDRLAPVSVSGLASGVAAFAAGKGHTCALTTDGGVKCWGWNAYGTLGDNSTIDRLTPVDVSGLASGVAAISAGPNHSCALTASGGVKCWGYNASGEVGDRSTTNRHAPVDVPGFADGVWAIGAGFDHACALTTGGGAKCWGFNGFGQLGTNSTTDRFIPADVSGLTSGVAAVAAGTHHSCALTTGGGVKCWGFNARGQVGDNSTTDRIAPVDVSGLTSGVAAIAVGGYHTCALTTGGGVKCWGLNGSGQLGDNSTTTRLTPVDVSGLAGGVAAIAAGRDYTCALTTSGGAKCWGSNFIGQLGDNTMINRATPVDVKGAGSGVTAIAPGDHHTCLLTTGGGVKCWGHNANGEVGDSSTTNRLTPVDVSGLASGVAAVSVGSYHSCALTSGGGVKCWGSNTEGQLGDNTTTDRLAPVDVSGLASGVATIAVGQYHSCAITTGGGAKCWGYNYDGQLGDGTAQNRPTPTDIRRGQSIAFTLPVQLTLGVAVSLQATASGALAVTFDTWTPGICTVTGNSVTASAMGLCGLRASQSGSNNIAPAPQVLHLVVVGRTVQTITFAPLTDRIASDSPFTVSATGGGSGNPVTFSSLTPATCSTGGTNGTTVTLSGTAGACTIAADQAGNESFSPAPQLPQSFDVSAALTAARPRDLSGDGMSDVLLRGPSDEIVAWLMYGSAISSSTLLLDADSGYTATRFGDFDGDGKQDLLLTGSSGELVLWLMNGNVVTSSTLLLDRGNDYVVDRVGDFNGDGKDDILLKGAGEDLVVWLMNGATVSASAVVLGTGTGFAPVAIGDFDNDGKDDIVLAHTDGNATMWLMNGTTVASSVSLLDARSGYVISHVGDFNNDSKDDLLLKGPAGEIVMWQMNGTSIAGSFLLYGDGAWLISHVADVNADGFDDMVLQGPAGEIVIWVMNGSSVVSATLVYDGGPWQVTHVGDYNGDGKSDLLLKGPGGEIVVWIMNGSSITSSTLLVGATTWAAMP